MANGALFDAMMGAREPSPGAALEEARLLALQDLALPGRVSPDRLNRTIDAALEQTPPPAGGNPWLQSAATAANIGLGLLPITRVGRALSATVPRTLATLGGVGALNAAAAMPAEAQAPPPPESEGITSARGVVERLRVQQEELGTELAGLRQQAEMFNPQRLNPGSNPEDIKAAQRILKGLNLYRRNVDGNWGNDTAAAVETYLERIRVRRTALEGQLSELGGQLGTSNTELQGLLRDERVNRVRGEVGPFETALRNYGPLVAGLAGAGAGVGWRAWTRAGVNRRAQTVVDDANRLLTSGAPDDAARVANVNAFYQRGGGRPPFRGDQSEPLGFAPRADQAADATALYPPGRPHYQGVDAARMLGFGGTAGVAHERYLDADRRVQALLEEERKNPTESTVRDRIAAERERSAWDAARKFGVGALASYPVAARVLPYRTVRPDSQLAEAEVMRLNRLYAQNRGQGNPNGAPWRRPQVEDITLTPDRAGRYHRPSGHFASDNEVTEYQRMVADLERERRRRR